jgi:hypothetical protein
VSLTPDFAQNGSRIGLEDFDRAVFVQVLENINDALAQEGARWAHEDMEFNALIQKPAINSSLEQFRPATIHIGHRPSMVEAPVENYPSMAIMSFRSSPIADQNDQSETSSISLSIEAIVRSGPFDHEDKTGDGETAVNRRAKRTAEAINHVMLSSRNIVGFTPPERAPVTIIGDVWTRDEQITNGNRWYFQGIRLEYAFRKMSVYGNLDIDQPN